MKKLNFVLTVVLGLALLVNVGCQKQPNASFTVSKTNVVTGEEVTFINTSSDASSYKWNFGDGKTSTEKSPKHVYENQGSYPVELTAYSKNEKKSDKATITINVTKGNEIVYDNQRYPLTKCFALNYGLESNFTEQIDIYLTSDNIYHGNYYIQGTGNAIYLWLYSSIFTEDILSSGNYIFSSSEEAFTIKYAKLYLNYNFDNETGTKLYAVSGTLLVTNDYNGETTFEVTLLLENGKTVKAYFKGIVQEFDHSKKAEVSKKIMLSKK